MKRGLKVQLFWWETFSPASYNRYPDEKGTERSDQRPALSIGQILMRSYNRYPDEKGTESSTLGARFYHCRGSYNRYPDEKGTESRHTCTAAPNPEQLQPLPR